MKPSHFKFAAKLVAGTLGAIVCASLSLPTLLLGIVFSALLAYAEPRRKASRFVGIGLIVAVVLGLAGVGFILYLLTTFGGAFLGIFILELVLALLAAM